LMGGFLCGKLSVDDLSEDEVLGRIQAKLEMTRKSMQSQRTANLWMQYMSMVDILRKFLKAERTGDWNLHLQCLYDMLPYFAASGHNLYTKSVYIYLQKMTNLHMDNPEVYQHFTQGLHVVRRSERIWAGLSTDLVIEQVRYYR